jgi:transposase InsO family protein
MLHWLSGSNLARHDSGTLSPIYAKQRRGCIRLTAPRGENRIEKATTAVSGTFSSSCPLETVEIDHTKADVFLVDEETREPIRRPLLTLAMEVCSRMVTRLYLTMEAPSRLSTSQCLLHSLCDKTACDVQCRRLCCH